jgi:predicted GNAT family N-acyltransferase
MNLELRLASWDALRDQAGMVRRAVFVSEQGIDEALEWDERDAVSLHCLALIDGEPIGTGRLLPDGHIGRMAVLPHLRNQGVGARVLEALVAAAAQRGDREVMLSAQCAAQRFYERHGFVVQGEPYLEVGIRHVAMSRLLNPTQSSHR